MDTVLSAVYRRGGVERWIGIKKFQKINVKIKSLFKKFWVIIKSFLSFATRNFVLVFKMKVSYCSFSNHTRRNLNVLYDSVMCVNNSQEDLQKSSQSTKKKIFISRYWKALHGTLFKFERTDKSCDKSWAQATPSGS